MYYILRFLQHACSVIKFVILTIVCRSKRASELMLHCYVYSTLNKSSMSIRVGKKYRYAGIPRYLFGVVRTAANLPVPRYSGFTIYSNRKP